MSITTIATKSSISSRQSSRSATMMRTKIQENKNMTRDGAVAKFSKNIEAPRKLHSLKAPSKYEMEPSTIKISQLNLTQSFVVTFFPKQCPNRIAKSDPAELKFVASLTFNQSKKFVPFTIKLASSKPLLLLPLSLTIENGKNVPKMVLVGSAMLREMFGVSIVEFVGPPLPPPATPSLWIGRITKAVMEMRKYIAKQINCR